jgi:hypothetical protein
LDDNDTFEITALIRNAEKTKVLDTLGINTVVASLSDDSKITEVASDSPLH